VSGAKAEILRRLRLGDLRRLLRSRYGPILPNDSPGRESLRELLLPVSLAPENGERMITKAIEVWTPWMDVNEARQLFVQINRMSIRERKPTARVLGKRLRLTNRERERLRLWSIRPFDMTDRQMHEQRKAKARAKEQQRRLMAGSKPRETSKARTRPWEAENISRRTWFRRRAKAPRETSPTGARKITVAPIRAKCRSAIWH
jgi:hypothetical protein